MTSIKTTIAQLTSDIRDYERRLAPGSETALWGDYCEAVRQATGYMPWDDEIQSTQFADADWWLEAYRIADTDRSLTAAECYAKVSV